jgi:hypothetical protein
LAQQADRIAISVLREAEERPTEMAALGPNWDSYGGDPPTALAIAGCGYLLTRAAEAFGEVAGERLRPFAIAATPEGGTYLDWRSPDREVSVDIGPTGSLGYLFIQGQGEARRFSEAGNVSLETILDLVGRVVGSQASGDAGG